VHLLLLAMVVAGVAAAQDHAAALDRLFESEWEYRLRDWPTTATWTGDPRYNGRWPDLSLAAWDARARHYRDVLAALAAIPTELLSPTARVNYDLFRRQLEDNLSEYRFRLHLTPIGMRGGIQTAEEIAAVIPFRTARDYQDWIARMRALPRYMDQTIALMKEGMRVRMMLPKVIMSRVPAQIGKQIVSDPRQSPFYKPFRDMAAGLPETEKARLRQEAETAIAGDVVPAFRRLGEFFSSEYLPACYGEAGVWQAPNGAALYEDAVRRFTTTRLTPREIHEIGLSEVSRIRDEMHTLMRTAAFQGTLQEFFSHLRTSDKFFFRTPEELLNAYMVTAKRVDPLLVRVFRILPRTPYGVEAIPANIAPDTTTAYYRPPALDGSRAGTYFVNLYRPEVRPKWEMMALTLHEAVPGHHLQIALAQEMGEVPKFRRMGSFDAFVEGWALYAESLGEELGLYDDPYAKFGRLTYEMWRAVRLVVDTGIHAMKWDRRKAIDYFLANAAKTELDVTNEIDRYIGWPGQALAYKTGELKIKELRGRSEKALGARFDLRDFHDAVLSNGAIPLDMLEANIGAWIKSRSGG
jgi:uncharacterized protein (DUF885 family)